MVFDFRKRACHDFRQVVAPGCTGEEQLERVYRFDLSLMEGVEEVEKKIAQLDSVDKETALGLVKEATKLVTSVEKYFAKREEILRKGS